MRRMQPFLSCSAVVLPLVLVVIGFTAFSATLALALELSAADESAVADDTIDADKSFYSNPAQAAHASQLADKAALSNDEVQQAYDNYQEALDTYGEDSYITKNAEVDFTNKLADITGELDDDIEAMRASGMGWGNIAHELGVHPSTLGLGHAKNQNSFSDQEIAEATARNTKNGFATRHGVGRQSDIANSKQGKSAGNSSNAGGNKGEKGNNGKSGGKGGGNGGGNGGGKK
jgi:hypothetical protein